MEFAEALDGVEGGEGLLEEEICLGILGFVSVELSFRKYLLFVLGADGFLGVLGWVLCVLGWVLGFGGGVLGWVLGGILSWLLIQSIG